MNGFGRGIRRRAGFSHDNRRRVLAGFLGVVLAFSGVSCLRAQDANQRRNEQSCRDFVQQFYNWYLSRVELHLKSRLAGPPSKDVLRFRPQVLSTELAQALKVDIEAQAKVKDDLVGLDFDPFLNSQDTSSKYEVASVRIRNGQCNAVVNGIEGGKKQEQVMPELTASGAAWVFVNFHYGKSEFSQDENLVRTLKLLSDERRKARK
jgi:Protein of unknown function (DUF3828)